MQSRQQDNFVKVFVFFLGFWVPGAGVILVWCQVFSTTKALLLIYEGWTVLALTLAYVLRNNRLLNMIFWS